MPLLRTQESLCVGTFAGRLPFSELLSYARLATVLPFPAVGGELSTSVMKATGGSTGSKNSFGRTGRWPLPDSKTFFDTMLKDVSYFEALCRKRSEVVRKHTDGDFKPIFHPAASLIQTSIANI